MLSQHMFRRVSVDPNVSQKKKKKQKNANRLAAATRDTSGPLSDTEQGRQSTSSPKSSQTASPTRRRKMTCPELFSNAEESATPAKAAIGQQEEEKEEWGSRDLSSTDDELSKLVQAGKITGQEMRNVQAAYQRMLTRQTQQRQSLPARIPSYFASLHGDKTTTPRRASELEQNTSINPVAVTSTFEGVNCATARGARVRFLASCRFPNGRLLVKLPGALLFFARHSRSFALFVGKRKP